MKRRISADEILIKYGITDPSEIDLEAIALCEQATVHYKEIEGSEARLMGLGDMAIITINPNSKPERQRFSLAHELGHWIQDRGTIGKLCKREVIGAGKTSKKIDWTEVAANKFASGLLMPMHLFKEDAMNKEVNFETVEFLRSRYKTSLMATALRLIEADTFPCALAYSIDGKIQRLKKSSSVPDGFWYHQSVSIESSAVTNIDEAILPREVISSAWFNVKGGEDYFIEEHCVPYWKGVLSLLWWKDESQILDYK